MTAKDVLVKVEGLHRYYDDYCAVRDVNFELRKGEILGFLGPNGAGKSTTMHMISGNLAPSAGRIVINGHDLLDEPRIAKSSIGYLPEQPPLYLELTVDEYLDYCARLNRISPDKRRRARESAKAHCGLDQVGTRLIANLSKGFQQRVGIAQAIIHSPDVVILDEPTVGLDPIQIREIRTLIRELGREHSVILSTHILNEVQAICSRVQIIHQGRLVFREDMAGLDEQLRPSSLVVGLEHPPALEAIKAISGVSSIERLADGRIRIHHELSVNPAPAIAERAVQEGWGLAELTPERKTLEQIFVELTATDRPDANVSQEEAA